MFYYNVDGIVLPSVTEFCDLGVLVDNHLLFVNHIASIVSRAKRVSGIIFNVFKTRSTAFMLTLYKAFVRPILEFNTCIWSPHLLYLVDTVESVQRNFTCRIPSVHNMTYQERLSFLNLESLEQRRLKTDCKWLYRLFYCYHDSLHYTCFNLNVNTHLRGHSVKFICNFTYNTIVKHSFFYRVIPVWNSLNFNPSHCVNLNEFIRKLHKCSFLPFLKGRALV